MGSAYQKSHKQYFGTINKDFMSVIDDTQYLAEIYKIEKVEQKLKNGRYLSLRNNPFKKVTVKASVTFDGNIIFEEDNHLVACRIKEGSSKVSKDSKHTDEVARVEYLDPRFKTKAISVKRTKRSWSLRTTTGNTSSILQCEAPRRNNSRKVKRTKSNFNKRKYNLKTSRRTRPSKASKA